MTHLDKTLLKEIAQRRSLEDLNRLILWADRQLGGASIFPQPDSEVPVANSPSVVELDPTPAPPFDPPPLVAVPDAPQVAEPQPADENGNPILPPPEPSAAAAPTDTPDTPSAA